ncbi:MAG: non-canonical purine NTP pyrophosphatase [Ignavibacteriales bacterium]
MKIVVATNNKKKLEEIRAIMQDERIELISLDRFPGIKDIPETGTTFRENAVIKAKAVYNKTGFPSIADDSGIALDQLEGRPGVYSARYAGKDADDRKNNAKLQEELSAFPEPHTGRYICAAVFYDGVKLIAVEGKLEGRIIKRPQGDNGFGYDPYFMPIGYTITTAEMNPAEKNRISHRYHAFTSLKEKIFNEILKK